MEISQELQIAWDEAVSFDTKHAPTGLTYIGTVIKQQREYLFYRDGAGKHYYQSRPVSKLMV